LAISKYFFNYVPSTTGVMRCLIAAPDITLGYITLHESRLVYANLQYKKVQQRITIVTIKTEKITE